MSDDRNLSYKEKRETFQTPYQYGPPNCKDIRSRVGQRFEIVGIDFKVQCLLEGEGGPQFMIKFPDGLVIQAHEEEVFADAGWNPD